MQLKYSLLIIIFITFSCSEEEAKKAIDNTDKEDISINFIKEDWENTFEDTLTNLVGLQSLEQFVLENKDDDIEVIRLVKRTFAFGINDIRVIEVQRQNKISKLTTHKLKFDFDCGLPAIEYDGKPFTSDCFEIISRDERLISEEEVKQLSEVIGKTELLSTKYLKRGKMICDGDDYSIKFANTLFLATEIFSIRKSCPGEKTAISLVGEELIKMSNDSLSAK